MSDYYQRLAEKAVEECNNISDFGWHGEEDTLGYTWAFTFAKTRDADPVDIDNFRVVKEYMEDTFPDDTQDVHCGHWACGWVDYIMVRMLDAPISEGGKITKAGQAALEFREQVAEYPLLDEDGYSERYFTCQECGEACAVEDMAEGPNEDSPERELDLWEDDGPYCDWCWGSLLDKLQAEHVQALEDNKDIALRQLGYCPECAKMGTIVMLVPELYSPDPKEEWVELTCGCVVTVVAWLCEQQFDVDEYEREVGCVEFV